MILTLIIYVLQIFQKILNLFSKETKSGRKLTRVCDVVLTRLLSWSICWFYLYIFINVNNDENTKAIWWILEGLISLRAFIDFIPSSNDDTVIAYKHILHKGFEGNPYMRNCNSTTLHPYTCWDILIHLPVYDLFFLATLILVFIQQKP